MKLVIGGFAQGKHRYIKENFPDSCKHLLELDKLAGDTEGDIIELLKQKAVEDPELIAVSTIIGCGIVPLDKDARLLRRRLGALQCEAARLSDQVIKVECGIGLRIK